MAERTHEQIRRDLEAEARVLRAEVERLRGAINEVASVLDTAGRGPDAAFKASLWVRTGFPLDHPNYLTPDYVRNHAR